MNIGPAPISFWSFQKRIRSLSRPRASIVHSYGPSMNETCVVAAPASMSAKADANAVVMTSAKSSHCTCGKLVEPASIHMPAETSPDVDDRVADEVSTLNWPTVIT